MSTVVSYNGSSYTIPSEGDSNWSDNVTNYLIALASGSLTKAGGSFALTAEVDFGSNFGLKSIYLKSKAATNPASSGFVRLGNAESVKWRNAANNADLDLTVNSSNALQFNGSSLAISGNILNADINALAAIDYSKLNLSTSIVNSDISTSAAIAYSKLNLSGSILNADINASAAIAYSKLNLSNSILNADINSSAAIALSKLAALTTGKALQSNASTGVIEASSVTNTELSRLSGIGSSAVGISDTQVLTNKDIDGGTAANTRRLTLPKDTLTNLTSLTRKQGTLVFDTTSNKPYYDDGSNLRVIGSGSGSGGNLIDDGDAEAGTSNYVEGSYSAATRPSGTFTSSSGSGAFAITTSSSSPLSGNNSFVLTKSSGASRQGRAVERTINLDLENRAKVLEVRIKYIVNSGSFVAGSSSTDSSLIWYIGQYNGSTWTYTEPSSFKMLSSSTSISDVLIGNFQTNYDTTQVKLIAYVAESADSAWAVKCEVAIQPCNYVYGTPISDWQSYTPTATNFGNGTTTGFWRRVGDSMQLSIRGLVGSSAPTGTILFSLPSGYTFDSTKYVSTPNVGNAIGAGSSAQYTGSVTTSGTNQFQIYQNAVSAPWNATNPVTWVSGNFITLDAQVSITGWSSSTQMSDSVVWDDDVGQVQAFAFSSTTPPNGWLYADGSAVNRATYADLFKKIGTTFGAGDGSTTFNLPDLRGIFVRGAGSQTFGSQTYTGTLGTKQNDGFEAHSHSITDPGHSHQVQNTQDGNSIRNSTTGALSGWVLNFSGTNNGAHNVIAQAGGTNITGTNNTGGSETQPANIALTYFIKYTRGVAPVISATEVVAASYTVDGGGQSLTSTAVLQFNTKVFDTHNAVTTGASWKFTAPYQGIYRLSYKMMQVNNTGSSCQLAMRKNAAPIYRSQPAAIVNGPSTVISNQMMQADSVLFSLNSGDYIDVYINSAAASGSVYTATSDSWINIEKIK